MRGFIYSSIYFIMFFLVLSVLSYSLGSFDVPPHKPLNAIKIIGNSAASFFGSPSPCYFDINTFDELNHLSRPEVKPC